MFLHCYINDIKNTYKYFSKEIIDYVVNLESNDTDIIYFQAVILGDDDICEIFEVEQNEKLSLEKLLHVYYERGFCYKKENIAIMISSYYEHGKGVQKDLSKALEYMDSVNKNSIGSIRLRKKIEDEKNRAIRDPKNIKLTQEYSNKTFDTYLENNPDFKQQIEKRYLELDTKELEKELICRNELLDDNYEIPFIYRKNKFFGFSIKLVAKIREDEENEQ